MYTKKIEDREDKDYVDNVDKWIYIFHAIYGGYLRLLIKERMVLKY